MKPNEINYYEILEVDSKATQAQIKDAYNRLKQTFKHDNNALYGMMSGDDINSWISKIEEAYHVLSDIELKSSYDQRRGIFSQGAPAPVFNLNRTPPMQKTEPDESVDPLVAPATDFSPQAAINPSTNQESLTQAMQNEKIWRGAFIRKTRELQRITLDDLSQKTKISKSHLQAIEDESLDHLPAVVYLRGFLTQIAKALKIPVEPVVASYIEYYKNEKKL